MCKAIATCSPPTHCCEPKRDRTSKFSTIEVLVNDRVPPRVQPFESETAAPVCRIHRIDFIPQVKPQPPEVGADAARLSIPAVELTASGEFRPHHGLDRSVADAENDMIGTLGMQVSTKALKLRSKQHGISLVDLLSGVPSAAPSPSNGGVRLLDLIERGRSSGLPLLKRN